MRWNEYEAVVVVVVGLVVLLLGAVATAVWKVLRAPAWHASMSEDDRDETRFRSFWSGAVWSAGAVVVGLVLATVTWRWWMLMFPGMAALFCGQVLLFLDQAKISRWYGRYQIERAQRGLPPRRWWDGRLD